MECNSGPDWVIREDSEEVTTCDALTRLFRLFKVSYLGYLDKVFPNGILLTEGFRNCRYPKRAHAVFY